MKKNKVEKHWQQECPGCTVLSCLDCGKDFAGEEYSTHTSCISEAEKYQGKFYTAPTGNAPKGQRKQEEWTEKLKSVAERSDVRPQLRSFLIQIVEYPNVPRKKAKFQNFVRNSLRVTRQQLLDELWDLFSSLSGSGQGGAPAEAGSARASGFELASGSPGTPAASHCKRSHEDDEGSVLPKTKRGKKGKHESFADSADESSEVDSMCGNQQKKKIATQEKTGSNGLHAQADLEKSFRWKSSIVQAVSDLEGKYPGGVPIKRLRKKVLLTYAERVGNSARTDDQLRALFAKKLHGATLIFIENDLVRLK